MITQDLVKIGFKALPHLAITNSHRYDLGRNRHISVNDVGTASEMMWICETDEKDENEITDLVCIHNYDYDGVLNIGKVIALVNLI